MDKEIALVDANSIGFAAHHATKLSVGGFEVQAIFGIISTIRMQMCQNPGKGFLLLWDGDSWRKKVFAEYKGNRDSNPKMVAARETYKKQRPFMFQALKALGVKQLIGPNLEADDLAGIMAAKAEAAGRRTVMISGDQDWLQLVGPNTHWFDPIRDRVVNIKTFEAETKYKSPAAFLQGKALQGDQGDNIPGVGGIGEKGAIELLATYGSVENFLAQAPTITKMGKKMRDFAESPERQAIFKRNMQLMDLRSPIPEGVNASSQAFMGPPNFDEFRQLCERFAFKSILERFDEYILPFHNPT